MYGRSWVFRIILLVAMISIVISCGPKKIGFGVLLWSIDEQKIATGSVVPIFEDSSIRDIYIIGTEDDGETMMELPRSRIDFFKKEKEALEYAELYDQYKDLYATTLKDGLAIRVEPDELSERVYKLREGQVIKVIDTISSKVIIGEHEDNWHLVLTEEGVSGYCFGYNIDIYDINKVDNKKAAKVEDPKLEAFLNRVYRPEYFKDMLDEERIDLERFTTSYGIFPNIETRRIRLVLPESTQIIEYDSIRKTGTDRFVFTNSPLEVLTLTMNKVLISLAGEKEGLSGNFHYIDGIEDIRIAEQERRETLIQQFSEFGTLRSAAYGVLDLYEDGRFRWEGYDRLIPSIIPEDAGTTGTLSFGTFLSGDLKPNYDGAVSFQFEMMSEREFSFLYNKTEEGLRLVYVPEKDLKDNLVVRENPSPIVLFFSF